MGREGVSRKPPERGLIEVADWKSALQQIAATLRARQFAAKVLIGELLKTFNGIQVAAFPLSEVNPYRFGILCVPIQNHGSKVFVWNTMAENWLGGKASLLRR